MRAAFLIILQNFQKAFLRTSAISRSIFAGSSNPRNLNSTRRFRASAPAVFPLSNGAEEPNPLAWIFSAVAPPSTSAFFTDPARLADKTLLVVDVLSMMP
jgi:hypothetical protein